MNGFQSVYLFLQFISIAEREACAYIPQPQEGVAEVNFQLFEAGRVALRVANRLVQFLEEMGDLIHVGLYSGIGGVQRAGAINVSDCRNLRRSQFLAEELRPSHRIPLKAKSALKLSQLLVRGEDGPNQQQKDRQGCWATKEHAVLPAPEFSFQSDQAMSGLEFLVRVIPVSQRQELSVAIYGRFGLPQMIVTARTNKEQDCGKRFESG